MRVVGDETKMQEILEKFWKLGRSAIGSGLKIVLVLS